MILTLAMPQHSQVSPSKNDKERLFSAVKAGDMITVKAILKLKPELIKESIRGGWTVLHMARSKDNLVEYLIQKGADINARTNGAWTPLHSQAYYGTASGIRALLKHGADIEVTHRNGKTPLLMTIGWNKYENAKALIENGANVNVQGSDKRTPLIEASILGYARIVSSLLQTGGIDIDRKDRNYQRTALHYAALNGHLNVVQQLLAKGARTDCKDGSGRTPGDYALKYGHNRVARTLLGNKKLKSPDIASNSSKLNLLSPVKTGQARLWYLGRIGCAVQTRTHFLIFSYNVQGKLPAEPKLLNGYIDLEKIKNFKTVVFAGSSAYWHHNPERYGRWQKNHPDITFIYSFKDSKGRPFTPHYMLDADPPDYQFLPPGNAKLYGDLMARTIAVNSRSSAFLVKVDGLTIFYGGDMLLFSEKGKKQYLQIIDSLLESEKKFDIVCHTSNFVRGKLYPAHLEGIDLLVNRLKPALYFCVGSENYEYLHQAVAERLKKYSQDTRVFTPEHRGDMARFNN